MKNLFKTLVLLIILSCNQTETQEIDYSNSEDLQEKTSDIISLVKPRTRDIVGRLYQQALEQDSKLKLLENKISNIHKVKHDSLAQLSEYMNYNNLYYSSASQYAYTIKDSVKMQTILEMLSNSKTEFEQEISNLTDMRQLNSNLSEVLTDQHNLMKLIISERLLKTFQNKKPQPNSIESLNNYYEELITETSKYTKPNK